MCQSARLLNSIKFTTKKKWPVRDLCLYACGVPALIERRIVEVDLDHNHGSSA